MIKGGILASNMPPFAKHDFTSQYVCGTKKYHQTFLTGNLYTAKV